MATEVLTKKLMESWLLDLRTAPHRWALFPDTVEKTWAQKIRTGSAFDTILSGEYEATIREAESGTQLYVKYVGDPLRHAGKSITALNESDFQDPPPVQMSKSSLTEALTAIRNFPGRWFVFRDIHTAAASLINHARAYGVKPNEFTAVSRFERGSSAGGTSPSRCNLYVMCSNPNPDADIMALPAALHHPLLEEETPPNAHKIKNKSRPAGLEGKRSAVTVWLEKTVRPLNGEWATYPGVHPVQARSHIKNGTMYGARPGEFETEVVKTFATNGKEIQTLRCRVNPKWIDDAPLREAAEAIAKSKPLSPEELLAKLELDEARRQERKMQKFAREQTKIRAKENNLPLHAPLDDEPVEPWTKET